MSAAASSRIAALDLIRGVAVLGILAINIAAFAGGSTAPLSPHLPHPGTAADEWTFAASFLMFEGKMRALFTLLFGVSMALFIDRATDRAQDGELLQLRRLGWLALFGLLHAYLLWGGDILFTYAVMGMLALPLSRLPSRQLAIGAVAFFLCWHGIGMALTLPELLRDDAVFRGTAIAATLAEQARSAAAWQTKAAQELATYALPYPAMLVQHLTHEISLPFNIALTSLGETLPLMLLGMALYRLGLLDGAWPRRRLVQLAAVLLLIGAALSLALLAWAWPRGFPPGMMLAYLLYWTALPHLLMALAYLALLVVFAPALQHRWLGQRLQAAGRMAFSNYIATSLLMTGIFYGWGLGWLGQVPAAQHWPFVLLGWAMMLGWSAPWLARFRQGPLEWLWRSLTERRRLPFRY